ncbi:MAG: sodium:proton antiporter [Neisseriaceae bacterium]|nr:MAG: sodium:proton antiporter [Neisseriaceae bacterium]
MYHRIWAILFFILSSSIVFAGELDGRQLQAIWGLPFLCVLLSVAIGPLIHQHFWEKHYGKILLFWTLIFIIPFFYFYGMDVASYSIIHALLEEYLPFILLLLALYTVSGGILVWGTLHGTPRNNLIILAMGTFLSSVMGTTGAAMLLVRPLIRANENRKYRVHPIIFLIFLVANIGGGLTPIGDPPLFLGFLQGVDFFWTLKHMGLPVLLNTVILLLLFFILDTILYKKEDPIIKQFPEDKEKIRLYGKWNLLLLALIVGAVILSGIWKPEDFIVIYGIHIGYQDVVRDVILIVITIISLLITSSQVRSGNEFNWEPMKEVSKLFLAIFITIIPVLTILKVGVDGDFAPLVSLVTDNNGQPINKLYFWVTSALSSFLDNAPTYLVFFNIASGNANYLMHEIPNTLLAISMGAVFMGAATYIGNAPNFMVKSISEQRRVKMPSFFGYMLWSIGILVPVFILDMVVFLM